MMVECVDGPNVGGVLEIADDARIGHSALWTIPEVYDPDAPVYFPWTYEAIAQVAPKYVHYIYTTFGMRLA